MFNTDTLSVVSILKTICHNIHKPFINNLGSRLYVRKVLARLSHFLKSALYSLSNQHNGYFIH